MTTYAEAQAVLSEHVSLRWRLTALEQCVACLNRGDRAAAAVAYLAASRDPFEHEPLRRAVAEFGLMLAAPATAAEQ